MFVRWSFLAVPLNQTMGTECVVTFKEFCLVLVVIVRLCADATREQFCGPLLRWGHVTASNSQAETQKEILIKRPNFRAIRRFQHPISRLRHFARPYDKTAYAILNEPPVHVSDTTLYSTSQHGSWVIVFCSGYTPGYFTHIRQSYFTDNGAIRRLASWQWSNHDKYM